jgi:diadenosine tetraphosphate (Ap4A) HIT family hydrolase
MVFLRQFHARVQTLFNMNVAGQPTQLSVSERGKALPWRGEFLGFNVGINAGEAAGQTVMHCHIHLIPRRAGDNPNPRGGVRCVVPGKADYTHVMA